MTRVNRGSLRWDYLTLFGVIIMGIVWLSAPGEAAPGGPAGGQAACPVCGAAAGRSAVVVTDWETNREYTYHDISCAVRGMGTRFPWSRAVTSSAASGQRATLSRINGSWRGEPEEAVVAPLSSPQPGCENMLVFASLAEFRDYQAKHVSEIPEGVRAIPLMALPAQLVAIGAAQKTASATKPGVVGQPPQAGGSRLAPGEAAAQAKPSAFPDVPVNHWAAKLLEKVTAGGLMEGYPDGTFRGDQPVTRYELAAAVSRLVENASRTAQLETTATPLAAAQGKPGISPARSQEKLAPESLQLDRLIEIALEDNPQLKALRGQIAADRAKPAQARALPDPMLGVMADDVLHPDRGFGVEVRQMIPWPGKLRLMSETAAIRADRAVTDHTEKAHEVVAEVKRAYYDLYFLDRSVELAVTNKSLLADFVKIAQTKYAVGLGIQQDVLRAQVAQLRILDDLLMLRQQQVAARARLNALLNRPPEAPLGPAVSLARHQVTLPAPSLEQLALERRAMLKGMRLMVDEAETMHALAKRELKPDYEVRLGVSRSGEMGGGTAVSGMVMFTLPLYHRTKQDKAIEQRGAEVSVAQSSYEAQKTMIFAAIKELLAMLDKSDREAELLHEGIIPQAQLSLESGRAAYQVGKVDFLTLLDSQMALYDGLRDHYRAVTDYEKGVAELERAIGTPLDGTEVRP